MKHFCNILAIFLHKGHHPSVAKKMGCFYAAQSNEKRGLKYI